MKEIRVGLAAQRDVRLFRNNVGSYKTPTGGWVEHGLCSGAADLIGWKTMTITPDMVGAQVAVFTAVEVKTATGRSSPTQKNFLLQVSKSGGLSGVARSLVDAEQILKRGRDRGNK